MRRGVRMVRDRHPAFATFVALIALASVLLAIGGIAFLSWSH